MTIPIASTTITVLRPPSTGGNVDPYDTEPTADYTPVTVATGVRAVIWLPNRISNTTQRNGGARMELIARMSTDPVDLQHEDTVVDEATGEQWKVQRCLALTYTFDSDMDHMTASLLRIVGER